ncbi:electron transfer flavoprotein subunit alpha/FixB family protein [Virgibacillus sp. W0430]|uniref:electron transfer flavoprotein subunit alpha/FixB family protein n=1 Tax=Virgibacillus sp. W0430 TaxID=3391580 RepID=UPI003F45D292
MSDKMIVIGETKEGQVRNVTFEAIAAAKKVKPSSEIIGILFGEGDEKDEAQEMIYYGANRVITLKHERLANYTPDGYTEAVMKIIKEEEPTGIIMGHTAIGKDLTPKIASKLNSGLISDVTEINMEDEGLSFTRPIYSGKAFEKKILTDGILFFTIRPNNIAMLPREENREGSILQKEVEIADLRTVIKEVIRKSSDGVDMSEANVVVAGGRGVKSKEGFEPLYELANVLGGAVGASRGACDAGYCDYSLQIGQTGKVITPDLYIACGISGAIQHLAGMSNSKVIVAINKDPEANIFKIADYGIVGDLFEVIPLLIEKLQNIKQ